MFYRGSDIRALNSNEFLDGQVDGNRYPVIWVDFPEGVEAGDFKYQDISNLDEFVKRRERVAVTGGLTDTLPASIKFTKRGFPPGAVLHIDESNVATDIEPIDYSPEWFDSNPGVLAHVTTLRDGELRESGRIIGLLDVKDDKVTVGEHRRGEIENEATANRYTTERESVAFEDSIDISGAVTAVAMYLGTTGVSPHTIKNALKDSPGHRSKLGTIIDTETREVVAAQDDYRAQAEALYDVVRPIIDYDEAPFYIVAVESRNDVRAEDGRITPENFRFVYNGRSFDTDYGRNSQLLGGGA